MLRDKKIVMTNNEESHPRLQFNMSIEKQYHYDPYGEVVYESSGNSVNLYKYSGKEWDANQKAYDFGARMHMPSYARFTTMDPLCEKYYSISPYA